MVQRIGLWTEDEIRECPAREDVWLDVYAVGNNSPVSIICPGGAYAFVSHSNEGVPFAEKLNRRGHSAFILNYRVGEAARFPAPMEDLARAIQYVRSRAEEYRIDADRLSLWGSSAAGHLCAYFSARYGDFQAPYQGLDISVKPQSAVLIYPVVSLLKQTHGGTRDNLLGQGSSERERADKSADLIADGNYIPAFIFHCEDDGAVPVSNSLRLDAALTALGVRHELHLYPQGGHGCGLGEGTSAQGWIEKAIDFIESV